MKASIGRQYDLLPLLSLRYHADVYGAVLLENILECLLLSNTCKRLEGKNYPINESDASEF